MSGVNHQKLFEELEKLRESQEITEEQKKIVNNTHYVAQQHLERTADRVTAPDGSNWKKIVNQPDKVVWENNRSGDIVRIELISEKEEAIPESEWVGDSGQNTETIQKVEAEYPDQTFENNDLEDAIQNAKEWIKKYPDENGEYGIL